MRHMDTVALKALELLEEAGYKAYLVGGCVRDTLLGCEASDFDIATSALPEETEAVFSGYRVIETGIKHGTVTVIIDGVSFEITTFRTDGVYTDSRHPENVTFTSSIEEDLERRDFTVNSMAMGRDMELIDPFGGANDLANRMIRCTSDAARRFSEDALRIMRAIRFSSVLGFEIDPDTSRAIHEKRHLLSNVSVERIFTEFKKLLCGKDVYRVLTEYYDVIGVFIPEVLPAVGFDHRSRYHIYDVYTHIAKTVSFIEPDPVLRLSMFFHDIGKPQSFQQTSEGIRHFKGHPAKSADIAAEVLERLHCDSETRRLVVFFCAYHDKMIEPSEASVKRLFRDLSYDEIIMLCKVKIADSAAHAPDCLDRGPVALRIMEIAYKVHESGDCVSLKQLAVDGHDMMELGYSGSRVGDALSYLLDAVIDGKVLNEKSSLMEYIGSF